METPDYPLNNTKLAHLKLSLKEKLETVSRLDDEIAELIEKAKDLETEMNSANNFKQGIFILPLWKLMLTRILLPVQLLQRDFPPQAQQLGLHRFQ